MSVKRSLTSVWLQSVSSLLNMQWHVGMAMGKSPQITWSGLLAKARSSGNSPTYRFLPRFCLIMTIMKTSNTKTCLEWSGTNPRRNRKIGSVSVSPKSVILSRWSTNKPVPFTKFDEFRWISFYKTSVNAVSNVVVALFGPVLSCTSFHLWLTRILV